jgi:hypothetical protein
MLLVAVPVGVLTGIYAGYRTMGGLVVLMVALLAMITAAFATVVFTIRREHKEEQLRRGEPSPSAEERSSHDR